MKHYLKTIIFTVLLTIISTNTALAGDYEGSPWAIGFKGGLNISNKSSDHNWGSKTGYNAELFVDYRIYDFVFLRTGFGYTTKGANYTNTNSSVDNGFMIKEKSKLTREVGYLHAPLALGIRIDITDDFAISGLIGGYVEYGVSFKSTYKSKQHIINLESGAIVDTESDKETLKGQEYAHLKKGDIGAMLGIEGNYKNILLGFTYERGIRNTRVKSANNTLYDKWRNRNGALYIGYRFGN